MALKTVSFVAFKLFLYGVCRKGSCEMGKHSGHGVRVLGASPGTTRQQFYNLRKLLNLFYFYKIKRLRIKNTCLLTRIIVEDLLRYCLLNGIFIPETSSLIRKLFLG